MVSKPLVSLLMTLVVVILLARTHGFSTVSPQSDDLAKHSHTTMAKKNESSYLYFIGGRAQSSELLSNTLTDSTSRLSTATGEWETMRNMPTARTDFCGAVVDKKIYLFGGRIYEYATNSSKKTHQMASNDVYDCLTDTYTPLPPMPDYELEGCAAAVLGQSIYVSGGMKPNSPRGKPINHTLGYTVLRSLLRYDTRANQWTTLSPMSQSRNDHQLIELNGLLYAIGGDWDGNITEVYNATTNKWSNSLSKTLNTFIRNGSAATHKGKIYYLGYRDFKVYSPDTDQWTALTCPEQSADKDKEGFIKLVSMNGKLWSIGLRLLNVEQSRILKFKQQLTIVQNLFSYDPSTDQWTKEREIDIGRTGGFSAFVVNF